jgi:hypothetical protein
MKTNHLQAVLAINAARITEIQKEIAVHLDWAIACKEQLEPEFELDEDVEVALPAAIKRNKPWKAERVESFKEITFAQRKLAKAVELQAAVKAELKANKAALAAEKATVEESAEDHF